MSHTIYLKFDSNRYQTLYGGPLTSLSLMEFAKLPIGTILYDMNYHRLIKLHGFANTYLTRPLPNNKHAVTGYYNNVSIVGNTTNLSNTVYPTIPTSFTYTMYNTASTFKKIKKGTPETQAIDYYMLYYPLTEKIISCLMPQYYDAIKTVIQANEQYKNIVTLHPSMKNEIEQ